MGTKFFTFDQNNSGGYFVENDEYGVCEYVIIESDTAENACSKLELIGQNVSGFDAYCPCCGERWCSWMDESDGKNQPEIYGESVDTVEKGIFRKRCFVHYMDGTFKEFKFS